MSDKRKTFIPTNYINSSTTCVPNIPVAETRNVRQKTTVWVLVKREVFDCYTHSRSQV